MTGNIIKDHFFTAELKKQLKHLEFAKGEKILRSFDETKFLFVIDKGLVKVFSTNKIGVENIGAIYGPGDVFPLAWVINEDRPAVTFQAITKCKVFLMPIEYFKDQLDKDPGLYKDFIYRVGLQFTLYATIVKNLGLKFGKERLAYRLLVLASRYGVKKQGVIILPAITHQDLGSSANITRESVNREMALFSKQGILDYDKTKITIKDPERLKSILGDNEGVIFFNNI
jgi:CRP-like cAMP-binding protein